MAVERNLALINRVYALIMLTGTKRKRLLEYKIRVALCIEMTSDNATSTALVVNLLPQN